jgi:hypothetical protein
MACAGQHFLQENALMAQAFEYLSKKHTVFLEAQPCFFVATAAADGRVNVSPKGLDSLRVISPTRVMWLNITGSGNGNAAHIHELPRVMLMLSSFSGSALTLWLYGAAECLQPGNIGWEEALSSFPGLPAARQIFYLTIDQMQTSRGSSVHEMKIVRYRAEDELVPFCDRMLDEKLVPYQKKKNMISIDGK